MNWMFKGYYDIVQGEDRPEVVEGEGDNYYEVEMDVPNWMFINFFIKELDNESFESWKQDFKDLFEFNTRKQLEKILKQDDNLDRAVNHILTIDDSGIAYDIIDEYLRDNIYGKDLEEAIYYQELD